MKMVTITKTYSRKLSLKEIIGRYDNIEVGTSITMSVPVSNEEELNAANKAIHKKCMLETERDMSNSLEEIKKLLDDPKNTALISEGREVDKKKLNSSNVEEIDFLIKKEVSIPNGFSEEG